MNIPPTAPAAHNASVDDAHDCDHLYTPAMLAEILDVSVRIVRRWHRAGLLRSTKEVLQLPYFDFTELATARRLARWMEQGATVQSIERQLQSLQQRAAGDDGLDAATVQDLPITAEGKRLVLRQGDSYLEANGQLRFGFEASTEDDPAGEPRRTLSFCPPAAHASAASGSSSYGQAKVGSEPSELLALEAMINEAIAAEDVDDLEAAIDWYRSSLAAYGPNPDICFQLAELLYRSGDLAGARERYFMALELNPGLVEARANLGCVLAEDGQLELAVAAFEGTLEQFSNYADVHFHLARALDDLGQTTRAAEHWQRFVELAPASPWAEEAALRLSQLSPQLEF
ncbi:MAG: tetratricopeptide repeat protein [Planctomycetales bacterium]|nr:tetratricopeptide repeat protein [Planctomycetales bacterium]